MQTQTQQQLVRVIAAIVDERQLTLYQESGETIIIPQGDERLAKIVKHITPILASGPGAVAEVDLTEGEQPNPYKEYEAQASGKVSFFKVAKSRFAHWLHKAADAIIAPPIESVAPIKLGEIPGSPKALTPADSMFVESSKQPEPVDTSPLIQKGEAARLLAATDEIIAHAQPVSSPEFHEQDVGENGSATIIAVVENDKGEKNVVAGVEKLKPQITRAAKFKDCKGFEAFMQRVAAVAAQRRHPVEDLLKFLERGDLPIADDGCIVIYKVLRRRDGKYVDCHSQRVIQQVGSYVCMDPSMVDPNRRNECSSGLHVARRQYVGGFSGDVVVLAKVRPEDVIAVPDHDANKMRVCGYHILFELSDDAFSKLKANRPFTDSEEAKILLGRALAGDHDDPIEEVRITESYGGGLKIRPLEPKKSVTPSPKADSVSLESDTAVVEKTSNEAEVEVKAAEALPDLVDGKLVAPSVDPKAVVKEVTKAKADAESRSQKAQRLFKEFEKAKSNKAKREAAQALLDFKKACKLGWSALGLAADCGDVLQRTLSAK